MYPIPQLCDFLKQTITVERWMIWGMCGCILIGCVKIWWDAAAIKRVIQGGNLFDRARRST